MTRGRTRTLTSLDALRSLQLELTSFDEAQFELATSLANVRKRTPPSRPQLRRLLHLGYSRTEVPTWHRVELSAAGAPDDDCLGGADAAGRTLTCAHGNDFTGPSGSENP